MIDPSFYIFHGEISANVIGKYLGVDQSCIINGESKIKNIAPLDISGAGDLSFCEAVKSETQEIKSGAVLIRAQDFEKLAPKNSAIIVKSPRAAFAKCAHKIISPRHEFDFDFGKPKIEENVRIAPNCYIANSAQIGQNTKIGPNCFIGPGVAIGRDCVIEAGVSIVCAYIGDNVRIGTNSVIGKEGFGVAVDNGELIDVPQFGRVIIQDKVSIGALCTIDRGAFEDTIIGLNSKIDNHCHVGHNSKLGQGVVIAAFGGISGSVEIGNYVMMGGRVGIGDHFKIGDGAKLAAGSAVLSDVGAGETFAGYPAKPKTKWMRELVATSKLVEKPKK